MKKLLTIAVLLATSVGVGMLAASGADDLSDRPASGPDTYSLGDFVIQYPFRGESGGRDESRAGVIYSAGWSAAYPGEVPCRITLADTNGNVVGVREFTLSSVSSFVAAEEPFRLVDVSGVPAQASGTCESVVGPSGQGYQFGPPRLVQGDKAGTTEFSYDVSWSTDEFPGDRKCILTVTAGDGTTTTIDFGLFIGTPTGSFHVDGPMAPSDIASTSIECAPPSG